MSHLLRLGWIIPLHFLLSCIWAIFRVLKNFSEDNRVVARGAVACSLAPFAVAGSHGWAAAQLSPRCLHSYLYLLQDFYSIKILAPGFFEGGSVPELCLWMMLLSLCVQFSFLSLSHLLPSVHSAISDFLAAFSDLDSWHALCKHTL